MYTKVTEPPCYNPRISADFWQNHVNCTPKTSQIAPHIAHSGTFLGTQTKLIHAITNNFYQFDYTL